MKGKLGSLLNRLFSGKKEKRKAPSAPVPEKQNEKQTEEKPLREKPFDPPVCYYGCPDSNRVRTLRTKGRSRIR